jgi:hypothetical protein
MTSISITGLRNSDESGADGEPRSDDFDVQGTAIADFLRQCAGMMRDASAKAVSQGYITDAAYCAGAAIVLETLVQKAGREGWSRTPPVP